MRIDNLTRIEQGYMTSTKFKTLIKLDERFEKNHSCIRKTFSEATYHDYDIYLADDDPYTTRVRAIVKNGVKYITREMNHLLKILKIIN